MKRTVLILALAASFLLQGCNSIGTSLTPALTTGCNGYASVLTVLAAYRAQGKLSAGQVSTVDTVNLVVVPICHGPAPADAAAAQAQVAQATATLTAIQNNPAK